MKNFSIQSKGHGDDNVMIGLISQDHLRFSCVGMMLEKHENAEVSKHCPRCECQQYDFFLYAFASHSVEFTANFRIYWHCSLGHNLEYFDLKSHLVSEYHVYCLRQCASRRLRRRVFIEIASLA